MNEVWLKEVEKKAENAFAAESTYQTYWPVLYDDEKRPKICEFAPCKEISRPRFVTVGEFSKPSVVKIGPFHKQGSTGISNQEKWVIVYLMNILYGLDLMNCLIKMRNQVEKARDCYSGLDTPENVLSSEDAERFAEMLLQDSYFILFVLTVKIRKRPSSYTLMPIARSSAYTPHLFRDDKTKVLDFVFNKDEIALDLLILDNQIPFFVIEELFKELKSDKHLHEYALEFFETIHPMSNRGRKGKNTPPEFLHLLDLFHWSRVPENKHTEPISPSPRQIDSADGARRRTPNAMRCGECAIMLEKAKPRQPDSINWARHIPNATELTESATTFEKKTSGSSLDITFRRRWFKRVNGVLDIPELHIRDYSCFVFHNLIAFEMQSSSRRRCAMAFSVLMRNLLQSREDVKLLRRRGVLASSSLSDKQLVDLFERLSRLTENHQMPRDLCDICHQVQSYHNHPVSQFCGSVVLRYFPNPLVTLSLFVAVLLFVPTLLQTIYAMVAYYHS